MSEMKPAGPCPVKQSSSLKEPAGSLALEGQSNEAISMGIPMPKWRSHRMIWGFWMNTTTEDLPDSAGHFILQVSQELGALQASRLDQQRAIPAEALQAGKPKFHLAGLAIGDGLTHPELQVTSILDNSLTPGMRLQQQQLGFQFCIWHCQLMILTCFTMLFGSPVLTIIRLCKGCRLLARSTMLGHRKKIISIFK